MATLYLTELLAAAPPAGGAATTEVIIATTGAAVLTAGMLALAIGHRSGRFPFIDGLARLCQKMSGIPGWASLPGAILGVALITAMIGMYWDISLHIDNGRDPGPLANPAHYLILLGLFGTLFAGVAAIVLPRERPSATAIKISRGWYAPLGGVLIFACASFALMGFPLDDGWHRLFGQDVTLWGPTHLMLIGGASLATLAVWLLTEEARRSPRSTEHRQPAIARRARQALVAGALLVGLSTFQAEFDFAVPQFRLVLHPILLMFAAGLALTAARVQIGRGGALLAVLGFLVLRGIVTLLVGPFWGQTLPHFPLYVVEALVVEAVALRFTTRRPPAFGALAGAGVGTVGLGAEWGWSHVWMTIPWPSSLLPEGALLGFVAAVSAGVLGAAIGSALLPARSDLGRSARWALPAAGLALVATLAYSVPISKGDPARADITLSPEQSTGGGRAVNASVKLDPPGAADGAEWFNVTAWQGNGSVVDPLVPTGPGRYRTTQPIPVHGNWKATLRLHRGSAVQGLPIFLPADEAIPAREVPARARMTRSFVVDKQLLQREQKKGVAGWLTTFAYLTVLAIALGLIAALAWGLRRFDRVSEQVPSGGDGRPGGSGPPHPAPARETVSA